MGILNTLSNLRNTASSGARNTASNTRRAVGNAVDIVGTRLNLPGIGLSEGIAGGNTANTGRINEGFGVTGSVVQQIGQNVSNNRPVNNPAPTPNVNPQNRNVSTNRSTMNRTTSNRNINTSGNVGISPEESQAEREASSFRDRIGGQYNELRTKFGNALTDTNNLLRDLPGNIRQLGTEYKNALNSQRDSQLGQVSQQRDVVKQDQKRGILSVAQDVAKRTREGAARLANIGASNSSASEMFQRALQGAANENTKEIIRQAANNFNLLDSQEEKIKSNFQTLTDQLDREETANLNRINQEVPQIINQINEALQRSGEFENLDKQGLTDRYLAALTPLYQQAKSETDRYRKQLEDWRMENQNRIGQLKNQIVQDFTPQEITFDRLAGVQQENRTNNVDGLLNPIALRRGENEEELSSPTSLLERVRRIREQR